MTIKIIQGLYCFLLIFITAMLGKYFTDYGLVAFYDTLILPDFTPENHYFSYAWGINYVLLFLGFYIVLRSNSSIDEFKEANSLFVMQLFLQILWTYSFFYMEQLLASAIVIVLLDMVVALMMHVFWNINKWAFIILIPYLLWILFATFVNIFIFFLN